jgi:hypothetical protein
MRTAAGDLKSAIRASGGQHHLCPPNESQSVRHQSARDLSVSHERIKHLNLARGELPATLEAYKASEIILERMTKLDPGNAVWQSDLSVARERIGDVQLDQKDVPAPRATARRWPSASASPGRRQKQSLAAQPCDLAHQDWRRAP